MGKGVFEVYLNDNHLIHQFQTKAICSMKNVSLIVTTLFSIFQFSYAQDCSQSFFALTEGTKIEMTSYNAKDKPTNTSESLIKSIKSNSTGFEATVESTIKNDKGKVLTEGKTYTVKCDNGTIKLDISSMMMGDMSSQMKSMEATISGEGIDYPSNLSEGMTLKDGTTEIKMGNNGMTFMTMKFDIKNRKVEKKESITTPAGTFDCFKITYDMDMKMMLKRSIKIAEWIAPGVGVVKTESYNQKGELENYTLLTKFVKP